MMARSRQIQAHPTRGRSCTDSAPPEARPDHQPARQWCHVSGSPVGRGVSRSGM